MSNRRLEAPSDEKPPRLRPSLRRIWITIRDDSLNVKMLPPRRGRIHLLLKKQKLHSVPVNIQPPRHWQVVEKPITAPLSRQRPALKTAANADLLSDLKRRRYLDQQHQNGVSAMSQNGRKSHRLDAQGVLTSHRCLSENSDQSGSLSRKALKAAEIHPPAAIRERARPQVIA